MNRMILLLLLSSKTMPEAYDWVVKVTDAIQALSSSMGLQENQPIPGIMRGKNCIGRKGFCVKTYHIAEYCPLGTMRMWSNSGVHPLKIGSVPMHSI